MPYNEKESAHPPENWGKPVWRYLSTSQLLSILEKDKLRFTRTDMFPDPYEGNLPENVLTKIDSHNFQNGLPAEVEKDDTGDVLINGAFNSQKFYNKIFFHSCWNYKGYESKPMWDGKSQGGEGVAIKTSARRFRDSFDKLKNVDVYIGLVGYGDYAGDLEDEYDDISEIWDWKEVHLHKPIEFEEENEIRATVSVIPSQDANPFNDFSQYSTNEAIELDWSEQPKGVDVPVHTDKLIEEIRLSPYADDWQIDIFEKVLDTYDIDAEVSKSEIFG